MNTTRTRLRVVIPLLAIALVAASCGDDDDDEQTQQAAEQPVRGGTLVMALESDPGSLNPAVTSGNAVHVPAEPMFNGLVGVGNDGNPMPELAERWQIEENGAVYRFTLRDNVRFHDGQPFTSADVKYSFEQVLIKFHSRTRASLSGANLTIETPNARTVVFRFPRPYAPLLSQLNVTEAPIIPRHVYEPCGNDVDKAASCAPNKAPVGTGPFKFVSYDATEVRMTRNPEYFRPGQPYLDNLVGRIIPDAGTRTLALQRKEVDWVWILQGPDVATLRGDPGVTLAEATRGPGGGNCVLTVVFNLRPPAGRPPVLTDLRVRQALVAATNRQQAADQILFGLGRVAPQPISTAIPVARAENLNMPSFDLNRAKQLLDQAGWKDEGGTRVARGVAGVPDGTPFKIDFVHFSGQQADYAQALRQQWREVGVELETKQMDNPTLSANMFTNRTFDTGIVSYCHESDPQIGVRRQYHSSQISQAPFTNGAGYSNPEMDRLWDESVSEVDEGRRRQLFQRIQELAVRDLPYWWLAETLNSRAYNSSCQGFNIQNTGLFAEGAYCRR
ncbi:MAG TPA: ABC transporter substrate-binding protein [Acidimicrobiales bacterium]|nr:ABC transporter substrate-binding protein [Acidimicrobiales bacterium]